MARLLRPGCVTSVRYFTARVKGRPDPGAPGRQKLYLRALSTRPTVSIHFGRFRTHVVSMPVANPSSRGLRFVKVDKTEEKGSDVNLGTYLLVDGMDGLYDEAVVVTNDSDLVEPIAQAKARFAPVHILSPHPIHVAELAQVG